MAYITENTSSEVSQVKTKQDDILYCKRCHRRLKDEKSKKLGYGAVCYKKIKKYLTNELFKMEE